MSFLVVVRVPPSDSFVEERRSPDNVMRLRSARIKSSLRMKGQWRSEKFRSKKSEPIIYNVGVIG